MKKKTNVHYVSNKDFLSAIIKYKKEMRKAERNKIDKPQVPEYIGECIIKIATHLAYKPNYINYMYRDEMIGDAIENCLVYVDNFDPKKSSNPFAYFTQICFYAFLRRIAKEKKLLHTKYKYIDKIDLNDLVLQHNDEESYDNGFIKYLQEQASLAETELCAAEKEKESSSKLPSRKPLYMIERDKEIRAGKRAPYKKDQKKPPKRRETPCKKDQKPPPKRRETP